jgi:hypothetical protein
MGGWEKSMNCRWPILLVLALLSLSPVKAERFQPGDIILLELNCFTCRLIAEETDSRFSHSGLVLRSPEGKLRVLESLRMVEDVSLESFLARSAPGASALVMRSFDSSLFQHKALQERMWSEYKQRWYGLPFDFQFLWDNFSPDGSELLYCSEFISKFLFNYLGSYPGAPAPMDYSRHYDFWERLFGAPPPQGKLGNNPASFYRDPEWYEAFEWTP